MSSMGEASSGAPRRGELPSRALYRQLRAGRRGRDGPSDSEVVSHQRARLYGAIVRAVATHGYKATTVRELSALAGVSTRTVYELFTDGKQECLLSAYDAARRHMARRMALAYIAEREGRERALARAIEAFAREVCEEPQAVRLVLVEVFAAGPAALERMERTQRLFEGMVDLSFRQAAGGVPAPPWVAKGVVSGIARVARVRLLEGRGGELPALTGELLEWALSFRSPAAATIEDLASVNTRMTLGADSAGWDEQGDDDRTRIRILDAVARLAAQDGYDTLTAARIAAAAGISGKRLHGHFPDVQRCFIAALEHRTERALACAAAAGTGGHDWPGGMHRALSALCAYIAADPALARLGFLEVFAPGLAGMRWRAQAITHVAESFRASAPPRQRPSELAAEASVGAVWGIVQRHIAHDATHRLAEIAPQLSFVTLAPAIGPHAAVRAIRAEHERMHGTVGAQRHRAGPGSMSP